MGHVGDYLASLTMYRHDDVACLSAGFCNAVYVTFRGCGSGPCDGTTSCVLRDVEVVSRSQKCQLCR